MEHADAIREAIEAALWDVGFDDSVNVPTLATRLTVAVNLASTPPDCDVCDDTGLMDWMIEADPNCYQEPDIDGKIPCPDCSPGGTE